MTSYLFVGVFYFSRCLHFFQLQQDENQLTWKSHERDLTNYTYIYHERWIINNPIARLRDLFFAGLYFSDFIFYVVYVYTCVFYLQFCNYIL